MELFDFQQGHGYVQVSVDSGLTWKHLVMEKDSVRAMYKVLPTAIDATDHDRSDVSIQSTGKVLKDGCRYLLLLLHVSAAHAAQELLCASAKIAATSMLHERILVYSNEDVVALWSSCLRTVRGR